MAGTIHDNQKVFMEWLETCPVVEFTSVDNVQEDSSVWIYTVDFAVSKEEQGTVYTGDAPSTEASFYKKSEVEDLDNQSYSEGEEYSNE